MTPLRILMLAPTPFFADRGCHVRIFEEARALKERGHEVEIATYHLGRDLPGLSAPGLKPGVAVHRIRHFPWYRQLSAGPNPHKLYLDAFLFRLAQRRLRDFSPHLIHAHLHEGCLIGHLLRLKKPVPLVFDYQGSLADEALGHGLVRDNSFGHRGLMLLERWINRRADFILVSSASLAGRLAGPVLKGRVAVIGDGVDSALFQPAPDPALRQRLGIAGDAILVVFLGLLTTYQGVDLLLESARLACAQEPRLHFLVMGYPDEDRYQKKALALGLAGKVTLPGRINYFEASACLAAGDIAVAPKICRTEANGKLLNYLACALPVAAFDTEVNREILQENAVYAELSPDDEPTSARRLAEAVLTLARDGALRLKLGAAGRRLAKEHYSWKQTAARIEEIYQRLLEKGER